MSSLGGSPSAEAEEQGEKFYKWKGKTYKDGIPGRGVNTSYSIEDFQDYMTDCPLEQVMPYSTLPEKFPTSQLKIGW